MNPKRNQTMEAMALKEEKIVKAFPRNWGFVVDHYM